MNGFINRPLNREAKQHLLNLKNKMMNHLATLINPECDKKGNQKKTKILEETYKVLEGTYKEDEEHITKLNQNRKDAKYWKITVINYR